MLGFLGYNCASMRDFSRKAQPRCDLMSTLVTAKSKQRNFSKKSKGQKPSSEPINWANEHQRVLKHLIGSKIPRGYGRSRFFTPIYRSL